jgi:two-component system LytT family response regulator
MEYKCIIVDDEPLARELLASHLTKFKNFELVNCFENALKAYEFLQQNEVDLMFLDIEMPVIKGNDFLKKLANPPGTIFTTAYREYALEGYELNVIDYLLKPVTFERFFKSIDKFLSGKERETFDSVAVRNEFVFIPTGNKNIKIVFHEVLYIESFKDYITIHLTDKKQHSIKFNISAFAECLNEDFLRIHRSYIINRNKLNAFSRSEVEIEGKVIPIGDSYKNEWNEAFRELSANNLKRTSRKRTEG